MAAARKFNPSPILKRMETTKHYPKFVQQNELAAFKQNEWETVSDADADVFLVPDDHTRVTAPAPGTPPRPEEKSEVRLLAALAAPTVTPTPDPSVAPLAFLTNSAFESLLASTPPVPPIPAIPPIDIRSSLRPTVPLGPPATLVVSQADVDAQKLASSKRLASLLSKPNEPLACALPRPVPLLPMVTKQDAKTSRLGWAVTAAALAAVIAAGGLLFGVAHHLKSKAAHEVAAVAALSAEREAEHSTAAPPPAPSHVEAAPSAPAPKKPAPTGPSQARAALAAGDLDNASALFEELAENPSTRMDGLSGLAEISHARGDLAGARARYRDILTESPQYFPAKLGVADTTWELGEKDAARMQYASLEASYPTRMIPARAHDRAKRR